jgi:hypothetical protein
MSIRFTLPDWLSRKAVQTDEQAELNNLCAAVLMVQDEDDRQQTLVGLRAFFDQRPHLLEKRQENRRFYEDFLVSSVTGGIPSHEPLRWRMLAEMSRKLKV